MGEYLVTCINKSSTQNQHEHITHIGNIDGNWRLTKENAIQRIDSKADSFYTLEKTTGKRAYIGVVRDPGKAPYLRTHADGKWNDNLLAQPTCSGTCPVIA